MTKHVGCGRKKGLTKAHEVDDNNKLLKTHVRKEEIKNIIMNYNKMHYSKAKNTPVY